MNRRNKVIAKCLSLFLILALISSPIAVFADTEVIIDDPTPDSTAPVLHSLMLTDKKVSPDKSVQLIAEAFDDLSGIGTIHASYRKPSGAAKNVSFQFDSVSNKYIGTISIGRYEEAGDYVLSSVTLRDKKENVNSVVDNSNTGNGNKMDFSPYTISVSGVVKDITPPELEDASISARQAVPGNSIQITAGATDDYSGVSYVRLSYVKPSGRGGSSTLYFNQAAGKYVGSISIDQYDELGIWKTTSIQVQDNAGNSKVVYDSTETSSGSAEKRDFSEMSFQVMNTTPDLIAPTLDNLGISLEQVSKNEAIIKLTAGSSDALSGTNRISVYYKKPNGQTLSVYMGQDSNGMYVGSIPIDKYDQLGVYKLNSITLYDNKSNARQIYDSNVMNLYQNTIDFSSFHFVVRGVITVPPAVPFSVLLTPKELTLEPGQSKQLQAILHMTDASSQDVTLQTAETEYTSSDPSKIEVDQNGLITVAPDASPGIVYIEALNSGLSGQTVITISGEPVEEFKGNLRINPLKTSLAPGDSKQFNVIVTLPDGTAKDVTLGSAGTQYVSMNETAVSVSPDGLIQTSADAQVGRYIIKISNNGLNATSTVIVTPPPTVRSLLASPATAEVVAGQTVQMSVRAYMTNGSTRDVTLGESGTIYSSTNTNRATVDDNGLITLPADATSGMVYIYAKNSGGIARTAITVINDPANQVMEMSIDPETAILAPGMTQQMTVNALMGDGNQKDLTAASTGTIYKVSNARATVDSQGKVWISSTSTYGPVVITAINKGKSATLSITVQNQTSNVDSIIVEPNVAVMGRGDSLSLKVTASMSDGMAKDVTAVASGTSYKTSNNRATVDELGNVTIPATTTLGPVVITANNGGKVATVSITVQESTKKVESLSIEPNVTVLAKGQSFALKTTATLTDGTTKDVTAVASGTTYKTSNNRATVDDQGIVTIPATTTNGPVVITANNEGKVASVSITVQDSTTKIESLVVEPNNVAIGKGDSVALKVTATLMDGTTKDVTAVASGTTYKTSNSRATVDEQGNVTIPVSATYGPVLVTATNEGKMATVSITVKDTSLSVTSISVTPSVATIQKGDSLQLAVTAAMADGTTKDVTTVVSGTSYKTSNSRATVDEQGNVTIPVSATNGPVVVTTTNEGKTATVSITVKDTSLSVISISVTPSVATIQRGDSLQLGVTAAMADGTTKDVTAVASGTSYKTSNSRATVDAQGNVTIPVSATNGPVVVTATNGGKTATVSITVKETNPTATSLSITPTVATLRLGESIQLTVTGTMSDGTTKDVTLGTSGTTYKTSNSRATVDANGLVTIASGGTVGPVVITAVNGSQKVTTSITVQK